MLLTGVKAGTGASGTAVLGALLYPLLWRRGKGMSSMVRPENNTSKPELDGTVLAAARMKCWWQRKDSNTPVPGLPEEKEATLARKWSCMGGKSRWEWIEWRQGCKGSLIVR